MLNSVSPARVRYVPPDEFGWACPLAFAEPGFAGLRLAGRQLGPDRNLVVVRNAIPNCRNRVPETAGRRRRVPGPASTRCHPRGSSGWDIDPLQPPAWPPVKRGGVPAEPQAGRCRSGRSNRRGFRRFDDGLIRMRSAVRMDRRQPMPVVRGSRQGLGRSRQKEAASIARARQRGLGELRARFAKRRRSRLFHRRAILQIGKGGPTCRGTFRGRNRNGLAFVGQRGIGARDVARANHRQRRRTRLQRLVWPLSSIGRRSAGDGGGSLGGALGGPRRSAIAGRKEG